MTAKNNKNVSRKDVAKAAGVSLTTVTHALNPAPGIRVNQDTRNRVQKIATELGYRPNFIGRALVTGKTYCIGLLEPHYESMFRDFYQMMIYGMVPVMGQDDYNLMLLFRDPAENCRRTLRQGRIDGMIILQSDFDCSMISEILEHKIPTIVLNTSFNCGKYKHACNVVSDHYQVVSQAVDKLVSSDCRNLVSFSDPGDCEPNKQIFEAFNACTDKLVEKGITATSIIPSKTNFRTQLKNLLKNGVKWDGIYLDGELYLKTLLEETAAAGMQLGKDFQLCLTDATIPAETAKMQAQGITIFIQQPKLMGETAWLQLKRIIAGKTTEKTVKVPYSELKAR